MRLGAARLAVAVSVLPLAGCNGLLGIGDLPAPSDGGPAQSGDAEGPGVDAGAADGHFCELAQGATFCADFDESEDAASDWTNSSNNEGQTTLELDDVFFRSAPRALHLVIPSDPPLCADALLSRDFGSFSNVRAEVALRPSATGSGGSYHQGGFFFFEFIVDVTTFCKVVIGAASDANAFVAEDDTWPDGGGVYVETDLGRPFPAEQWRKIVLTIDHTVSPTKFDVSVDDGASIPGTLNSACSGPITRSILGAGFDCTNYPHDIRYDNVRCDVTP